MTAQCSAPGIAPRLVRFRDAPRYLGGSVCVDHGRAGLAVLCEARRMTSDHRGGQDNANGGIPEAAG